MYLVDLKILGLLAISRGEQLFMALIMFVFYLLPLILGIYLVITVIRYLNHKMKSDD